MSRFCIFGLIVPLLVMGIFSLGLGQDAKKPAPKKDQDLAALVEGNNQFAFDLYRQLAQKPGNVVFSPYSISTALAMTYAGARGDTADKMARTLHFTLPPERLHPAFGELAADFQKEDKKRPYHLYIANALWPDKSLALQAEFLRLTRTHYGAGVRPVDFGDAEDSRKVINKWVEEKTKEKIKDLLLPGDVGSGTRVVLTNAIYFQAAWVSQFPKDGTRDDVFEVAPDKQVKVRMMQHLEGKFNYFAGEGFQWLELPYKGDRLSMVLVLPQQKGKLAELEKGLTAVVLQKGVSSFEKREGQVSMPRFKVALRLSLLSVLEEMGMSRGPFTALATGAELSISDVIHKAYLEVDEVGTEAAAATAVIGLSEKDGFSFRADHPFLFMIRDRQTRSILFLGRVTNPSPAG